MNVGFGISDAKIEEVPCNHQVANPEKEKKNIIIEAESVHISAYCTVNRMKKPRIPRTKKAICEPICKSIESS